MKIRSDTNAAALPLALGILTIIVAGALYSLLFNEIGFPELLGFIPASDSKTFILMLLRAMPLFVLFAFIVAMIKAGVKKEVPF